MNRKNYDTKTLSVFDTVGAYFIDQFYNFLYGHASDLVRCGKAKSITDAYRANIINYMNGITKPNLYTATVIRLHEYYQRISGYSSIVLSEFEDKVLSTFIPPQYYRDFSEKHKDKTLRDIIVRTVNELGTIVVGRDTLPKIIDDHRNLRNVTLLQDRMLEIFICQREDYYAQFAQSVSENNGANKVSKQVVEKLKVALVEEKKKKCELESDKSRALGIVKQLVEKIKTMENEIASLQLQIEQIKHNANVAAPPKQVATQTKQVPKESSQTKQLAILPKESPKQTPKELPAVISEESSDSETSVSDEDIYNRQKNQLKNNLAKPESGVSILNSLSTDDDPWGL